MRPTPAAAATSGAQTAARLHRWRRIKDKVARWAIAIGGVGVIWAVILIMFYLLWVVLPLFFAAEVEPLGEPRAVDAPAEVRHLAVDEQLRVGFRVDSDGRARFVSLADGGEPEGATALDLGAPVMAVTPVAGTDGRVLALTADGGLAVLEQTYVTDFSRGVEARRIVPAVSRPYGERLATVPAGSAVRALSATENDQGLAAAALGEDGRVHLAWGTKQQNFLSGETELDVSLREHALDFDATALAISGNLRWLYVSDASGRVHRFDLPSLEPVQVIEVSDQPITELRMLLGGISVLAGDRVGNVIQLFPVRDDNNEYHLKRVRAFEPMPGAISQIIPEARRKGFVVLDADGHVGIYHATAGQRVWEGEAVRARAAALAPRANQLVLLGEDGRLHRLAIDNEHPEISFAALWQKVWYENYQEPEYTWQSSASTNDFEPKFSLSPLAFGTLKAALYAMLFAVPLALMGAAYTAYFMAPRMRRLVKPTIEIMEALPTVILGFLAGLWFAPWVEEHLAGVFAVLLLVPLGTLLFAFGWHQADASNRLGVRAGWEPAVLLPVLVLLTLAALGAAEPLQQWFFGGDLRTWLSQEAGISYDQRNAMVVGAAMGFAVIPTIFSIAEDAIFGVPKSLPNGSLALGATPWQSLVRVVIPTASPGIFSALMIGMGRAVGETMIVLMATGNTPVMDWNIFEGMRTLSANIAVEMPESEVGSSHYRILFLAALVLFMFTFVVNTGAELIRQRLREKYSSL